MKSVGILCIGTELTRGELVNTNGAFIGEQLTRFGFDVMDQRVVPDDAEGIRRCLCSMGADVDLLVVTGGLGPTTDDVTAAAAAAAGEVSLVRDGATLEMLRRRWADRGRAMPVSNEKQALVPEGAEVIPNPVGTAPAFSMSLGRSVAFFLPGVPAEMKALLREAVIPRVAPDVIRQSHQIHLRTVGVPESEVADRLAGLEQAHPGVTLGYRAHFPEIEVKILARGVDHAAAERLALTVTAEVRTRLG
jgi:nicotinamide-nucleotide amidase